MRSLPPEILSHIFHLAHPGWPEPPWVVQHDIEIIQRQAELAGFALVCRGWRMLAQKALVRRPVVRLSWANCTSFSRLVERLASSDPRRGPSSAALVHALLAVFDASQFITHFAARSFVVAARVAMVSSAGLYLDNVPRTFLTSLDEFALVEGFPPLRSLGIRCVDAMSLPGSAPARLQLPRLPHLRCLHLCNLDVADVIGDALDAEQLEVLSLHACFLSVVTGASLRRLTQLRELFISAMAFPPALLDATFSELPASLQHFAVFALVFLQQSDATDRSLLLQPWEFNPNPPPTIIPPLLLQHGLEILSVEPALSTSFASLHMSYCRFWPSYLAEESAPTDFDWIEYPWQSDTAFQVDHERLRALAFELGFEAPSWHSLPRDWFRSDFEGLILDLRRPRRVTVGLARHLSKVAGVQVQFAVDDVQGPNRYSKGWGDVYICLRPRRIGRVGVDRQGTLTSEDEAALRRLYRRLGRPSEPPRTLVAVY